MNPSRICSLKCRCKQRSFVKNPLATVRGKGEEFKLKTKTTNGDRNIFSFSILLLYMIAISTSFLSSLQCHFLSAFKPFHMIRFPVACPSKSLEFLLRASKAEKSNYLDEFQYSTVNPSNRMPSVYRCSRQDTTSSLSTVEASFERQTGASESSHSFF